MPEARRSGWSILGIALVSAWLTCSLASPSFADTGVRLLDEPAIAVKSPARVVLIAVTTAGQRIVAVGEHGVIAFSDDNGQSWRQASVPIDVTLTAVRFATPKVGWAAGHDGVILNTVDGGATWQLQLNGVQASELTLAAAKAAVAQHDPSVGTLHALDRADHFVEDGPDKPFLTILARDENNATVFGAYRLAVKTTDGGKTWADWSLHISDALSHNIYDCVSIGSSVYLAGEAGLVFQSSDGGNNFLPLASPGPNTLFVVLPAGGDSIFVSGVAGAASRSSDGGKTWQAVPIPTSASLDAGIVLKSGTMLIGSVSGILYYSTDHGQSFEMFPRPQPQAIYGLAQAPDGDVIVVGSGGVDTVPTAELTP